MKTMPKAHPILHLFLWTTLLSISGATLIFIGALLYLSPKLPAVEKILEIPLQTPLRIFSKEGKLIAEFGEKKRTPVTFDQIPVKFTHAILAAEDSRFYSHPGVDIKGLIRAALELITTGSIKTGGSTVTMQVAKNYFLSRERTFSRKFNEILLALQIERELDKNKILELYVNKIYLGHRSYGIAAASQVYYGKPIGDLNTAQLAMIAGLPKAPSAYNPVTNPTRALTRRNWILKRMLELDYLPEEEYLEARQQPVTAQLHGVRSETQAPYVAEMVRKEMLVRYGNNTYTNGFRVFTTINSHYQDTANQAVHHGLLAYDRRHGYRGPESSIALLQGATNPSNDDALLALRGLHSVGPLIPAVVMSIEKTHANLLFKDLEQGELNWEASLWAKPFINTNTKGPSPSSFEDILKAGDIIRVLPLANQTIADTKNTEEPRRQWGLSQIPHAQSAMVSLNPHNGSIFALVGGFDFRESKFNRVIQSGRQAGSNFKPFVYAAALSNGMTAATVMNDSPIIFKDKKLESTWRPENAGGKFGGFTRLREALYRSKNLVSIRVLRQTGIRRTINFAEKFGFNKAKLPKNLSLALGVAELTPIELAQGYTTLANGGYHVEPWFIDRIENSEGEILFSANPITVCENCSNLANKPQQNTHTEEKEEFAFLENLPTTLNDNSDQATPLIPLPIYAERTVEPRIIYIINTMLKDVIKRGTGRKARSLKRSDIGGKTGTTNDQKDAWFSGFNPDIVTTVWVGFDAPQTLGRREYGGTAALPIWIEFMGEALKDFPSREKNQPEGLVTVKIDPETGKRATASQSNSIFEIFRSEMAPKAEKETETHNNQQEDDLPPEELF
ncbi:MAG: penicillin-binding protein 1A [Pseudomonadales bacterium]|nr:penicillin-binding protein 1A [Pseudomonadales bacterium]